MAAQAEKVDYEDVGCGSSFSLLLCGAGPDADSGLFGGFFNFGDKNTDQPKPRGRDAPAEFDAGGRKQDTVLAPLEHSHPHHHGSNHHSADDGAIVDDDSDQEPAEDYRVGGYHPVRPTETYGERFKVLGKLGWGVYSTVWLADDLKDGGRVALKIQRSAPEYYRAAYNEISLLKTVMGKIDTRRGASAQGTPPVAVFLTSFDHNGPHGTHPCMVFEALGRSLLMVLDQQGHLPVASSCDVASQLLAGLSFLHTDCGIIHTDLKPENILVAKSAARPELMTVKIGDFGNAIFVARQQVKAIQTREYRCPESILGLWPFCTAADIWSLGCVVYETLTGNLLFDPPSPQPSDRFCKDESHLASVIQLMGQIPPAVLQKGKHAPRFFDVQAGNLKQLAHVVPFKNRGVVGDLTKLMTTSQAQQINTFLLDTFEYDPAKRKSADELLRHEWVATSAFNKN